MCVYIGLLPCKARRQYLLNLQVSRYYVLALQYFAMHTTAITSYFPCDQLLVLGFARKANGITA